ncbi:MAG: exo-alpha-sialidase [Chloroflexi bacterium]|nr:exo-alpha-sialidase [Chloroflexota bacterium]
MALTLKTGDGGAAWRDVSPPEPVPPEGTSKEAIGYFLDDLTAWVTFYNPGGYPPPNPATVWHTRDGGQTWQASAPLDTSELAEIFGPTDLQFVDAQNGWLLSHVGVGMNHDYVVLYRTQDGGATWQRVLAPFNDVSGVQACMKNELYFSDAQNGWLTGSCNGVAAGVLLFKTADGGETWQAVNLPEPAKEAGLFESFEVGCGSSTPAFFSAQQGYIVVSCERFTSDPRRTDHFLYSTQDGGESWQSAPYPGGALRMLDPLNGWALGKDIYLTSDGWRSWSKISQVSWEAKFDFLNDQTGWATASSGEEQALVYTLDGGRTWGILQPVIAP